MAIEQARERGFLGDKIMGSNFSINIRVHEGLEAFIGGESTALMQSVEGIAMVDHMMCYGFSIPACNCASLCWLHV